MSRRLPIVGSAGVPQATTDPSAATLLVTTVWVDGTPGIAVVEGAANVSANVFVTHLVTALEKSGRVAQVIRSAEPAAHTRLLVIVGSHVPRRLRHPGAQSLWSDADLLLSEPSSIVAEALAAAL